MGAPKRVVHALNTLDVSVETITRPMAEAYLATQETNRRINKRIVSRYAADMLAGNWKLHGQGIQFDAAGHLIDGQHRLAAIVECGRAVDMLVVRGADVSVTNVIDVGRKRSAADQLSADGVANATKIAGALTLLWRFRNDTADSAQLRTNRQVANTEIVRLWHETPEIVDSLNATSGTWSFLVVSTAIFCHYLFAKINKQQADEFFSLLATGGGLPKESPILTLRNRLIEAKLTKQVRPHRLWPAAMTVKAWNAYRKNERAQLQWRIGGKNPETFPVPE